MTTEFTKANIEAIKELQSFRDVGEVFYHLGVVFIVKCHYELCYSFSLILTPTPYISPTLLCDYLLDGKIVQHRFYQSDLPMLIKENI